MKLGPSCHALLPLVRWLDSGPEAFLCSTSLELVLQPLKPRDWIGGTGDMDCLPVGV